jgi:hypothetical protein
VAHSRRAPDNTKIVNPAVTGKVREIAIAREGGGSVLFRSLTRLASAR